MPHLFSKVLICSAKYVALFRFTHMLCKASGTRILSRMCQNFCGPKRTRTAHLIIANDALYRMSYGPSRSSILFFQSSQFWERNKKLSLPRAIPFTNHRKSLIHSAPFNTSRCDDGREQEQSPFPLLHIYS